MMTERYALVFPNGLFSYQYKKLRTQVDNENNANNLMKTLSLSSFHKFVELSACDWQRTPGVVFWLKLVSVLGFRDTQC